MAKPRRVWLCRSCGSAHAKWAGKCPDCGGWDTLEDQVLDPGRDEDRALASSVAAAAILAGDDVASLAPPAHAAPLAELAEVSADVPRLPTGIAEFDRVLGGGLVPGSAVLIGGEPGIGKSTLLLQAAASLASRGTRVLYASSEESAAQVVLRARRLAEGQPPSPARDENLFLLAEANLARILEQARKVRPRTIVLDSIQMLFTPAIPAAPGSITQLRRCCAELVHLAKLSGAAVLVVGHVTKDGTLAGPRLLEHLVDSVLSFEGDKTHAQRVVRALKNRFGATHEIGLFEMTARGLRELEGGPAHHPSDEPRAGCATVPLLTGTRVVLAEVQALTATGFPGAVKRKCSGVDPSRVAMLIAVLERHGGLRLDDRDVFVSSVGGVRVTEPAGDLAILLAIAGAHLSRGMPPRTCAVGEVGLTGELRPAPMIEQRVGEAIRLGYAHVIVPPRTGASLPPKTIACASVTRALEHLDRIAAPR